MKSTSKPEWSLFFSIKLVHLFMLTSFEAKCDNSRNLTHLVNFFRLIEQLKAKDKEHRTHVKKEIIKAMLTVKSEP